MYYCKDFNSLSVLSLYEGELLGVVDKLYFDKNLKKLLELELIGENDTRLILPTKNIYHVGKNAITIKNNLSVQVKLSDSDLCVCPIGSKAYSINGEYLGTIKEISFNNKFLTENISLENDNLLEVSNIASCGKNTVIFHEKNEKLNLKSFTPNKQPKIFKEQSVQSAEIQPEPQKTNAVPIPTKPLAQTTDLLVGRICTKDIYNFNNELLIKANTKINKRNLREISKFNKLRELMLFIK